MEKFRKTVQLKALFCALMTIIIFIFLVLDTTGVLSYPLCTWYQCMAY